MRGVFRVRVCVFPLHDPQRTRDVEMVVDTGATYSVIPGHLAGELGISSIRRRTLTLANGATVTRDIAWAGISYGEESAATMVVLGEPSDFPLLGAHALEGMGLEVDANRGELRPTTLYLLKIGASEVGASVSHPGAG